MTPAQEFIEKAPLYTQFRINSFFPPASISRVCGICGKETTWTQRKCEDLYTVCEISGYIVTYQCVLCSKPRVTVFVMTNGTKEEHKVRKIGQFPAETIDRR